MDTLKWIDEYAREIIVKKSKIDAQSAILKRLV